jgi:hypothetical protein
MRMIAVKKRSEVESGEDFGETLTSCLASLLEIPKKEIPSFVSMPGDKWVIQMKKWLKTKCLTYKGLQSLMPLPKAQKEKEIADYEGVNGSCIVVGKNPNGYHAVIYKHGQLIYDPLDNKIGLLSKMFIVMIERI